MLVKPDGPDHNVPAGNVVCMAVRTTVPDEHVMLPEAVAVTDGMELSVGM